MKKIIIAALTLSTLTLASTASTASWWGKTANFLEAETARSITRSLNNPATNSINLSNTQISTGLRDALRIGTARVVSQLGKENGFSHDPKIHIPLPRTLNRVNTALSTIGMGGMTKDLELRLNRAAEAATPKAKKLFIAAINDMTIEDAKTILTGPNNAATQYLRRTMGKNLEKEMQPLISKSLAGAGAIKAYDQVMGQYSQIPFMPDVKANLNNYVAKKAMDGVFYYIAREEAAIRANPAKRTTEILKKVFASAT